MKNTFQKIYEFLFGIAFILLGVMAVLGMIALLKILVNFIW